MKQTAVSLIGAGPGDPGLITVHGLACLQRADVVIYDHLVSPRLLLHARRGAELIDVGASAPQPMAAAGHQLPHRREGARGQARGAAQVGRPVRLRPRRRRGALPAGDTACPSRSCPASRPASACPPTPACPVSYPGGGDTITLVRGFEDASRTAARHRLVGPGAPRRHRRLLRRARRSCRSSSTRCATTAGRRTDRRPWSIAARCRRRRR